MIFVAHAGFDNIVSLTDWWERIDSWISEHHPANPTVPPVVSIPEEGANEPVGDLSALVAVPRDKPYVASVRENL